MENASDILEAAMAELTSRHNVEDSIALKFLKKLIAASNDPDRESLQSFDLSDICEKLRALSYLVQPEYVKAVEDIVRLLDDEVTKTVVWEKGKETMLLAANNWKYIQQLTKLNIQDDLNMKRLNDYEERIVKRISALKDNIKQRRLGVETKSAFKREKLALSQNVSEENMRKKLREQIRLRDNKLKMKVARRLERFLDKEPL